MASSFRISLVFVAVCLPGRAVGQAITPAEILARMRVQQDALENLTVVVHWDDYQSGTLVATSDQRIVKDAFGRIRVRAAHGPVGGPRKITDELYNGEFTVDFREDPERNRLGEARANNTSLNGEHFKAAIINEGLGPDGKGPNTRRNPFGFIGRWVMKSLQKLVAAGSDVSVEGVDGEKDKYIIRFRLAPEDDPHQILHVAFVDGLRGWAITRYEQLKSDGQLGAVTTCEYAQDPTGLWLPQVGTWKAWLKSTPDQEPDIEWRFEVKDIAYNNPTFDDGVFDVSLPVGTHVTDNRYDVSYVVGEEDGVTTHLAELAQQALAEQATTLRRLKRPPVDIAQRVSDGWLSPQLILIILNVVVLVSIFAVLYWRKHG